MTKPIVEKTLGIQGDYQYKALRGKNYLQSNWHNNKLDILKMLLQKHDPQSVLDLGTGSGNFELEFANNLDKIVGLDYNQEALTFLNEKLKKRKIKTVKLIKQDFALNSNFNSLGKFDMVISIDVLEHIEISSVNKLIHHLQPVLNPNGVVVIVTPNYNGLWPMIEKFIDRFTTIPHLEDMQHITKFDFALLEKTFSKNNFKLQQKTTFNTFSYLIPNKKLAAFFNRLEAKLQLPFGNLILCVFSLK